MLKFRPGRTFGVGLWVLRVCLVQPLLSIFRLFIFTKLSIVVAFIDIQIINQIKLQNHFARRSLVSLASGTATGSGGRRHSGTGQHAFCFLFLFLSVFVCFFVVFVFVFVSGSTCMLEAPVESRCRGALLQCIWLELFRIPLCPKT